MLYIVIPLLIFVLTVFLHVFIHRTLKIRGFKTFKTVMVFLIGFIVNAAILFYIAGIPDHNLRLPWTGSLLFALISSVFIIFYTSIYLGDESPATKIMALLRDKKRLRWDEIVASFSDHELIYKRLDDLIKDGLIILQNKRFHATDKGKKLIKVTDLYRQLLNWDEGG